MVAALKKNGVPLWYVVGTNEGHGFAKKVNQDYLQAVEVMFLRRYLLGEVGSGNWSGALRDGSSIRVTPFAAIVSRFIDEPIEAARFDVGFELPIPILGVEVNIPGAKWSSLFARQFPDSIFDLLHIAHRPALQEDCFGLQPVALLRVEFKRSSSPPVRLFFLFQSPEVLARSPTLPHNVETGMTAAR
jgi:hypothetical protein